MSDEMPNRAVLDFERPIVDLERKIGALEELSGSSADFEGEIRELSKKAAKLQREIFADLTAQQQVQLSRHPARPFFLDYVAELTEDFVELHGDRGFRDDPAVVGGLANFDGQEVLVVGHQKGRNTKDNVYRNFGMPRPEGYRKCQRLFSLASRFRRPILTFIDTPGAYPGMGAEERGQAEAIAISLEVMASLRTPVIATVIGEGGSGGALAIGVADRLLMLEYSIYSVISPEGCASILWRDPSKVAEAAKQLKLTAGDLRSHEICDEVVREAPGGAHRDLKGTAKKLKTVIKKHLSELNEMNPDELLAARYKKFRRIGAYVEPVN